MDDFVRTADVKKTLWKSDTFNWSDKLNKIKEIVKGTIRSYKINNSPERNNETLLKKKRN